jgi:hypothetical protein
VEPMPRRSSLHGVAQPPDIAFFLHRGLAQCGQFLRVAPSSQRLRSLDAASQVHRDLKGPWVLRDLQGLPAHLVRLGRRVPRVSKDLLGPKAPLAQEVRQVLPVRRAQSARKVPRGKPDPKAPPAPPASAAILVRRVRRDRLGRPDQPAPKASLGLRRGCEWSRERKRLPATTRNNWCHSCALLARPMGSNVLRVQPRQACAWPHENSRASFT